MLLAICSFAVKLDQIFDKLRPCSHLLFFSIFFSNSVPKSKCAALIGQLRGKFLSKGKNALSLRCVAPNWRREMEELQAEEREVYGSSFLTIF